MARDIMKLYREKHCSAEQAMASIKPGFWIDYGFFNGKPQLCDRALAARRDELSDVTILAAVTLPPVPEVLNCDPTGEVFTYNDFHFSPLSRILQMQMGNVFYNPILYSECERYYGDRLTDPVSVGTPRRNASIVQTRPMDEHGYFNFGLHNSSTYTSLTHTDVTVVETNANLPYCPGGKNERIHISQVTHVVEGENPPLLEIPFPEPTGVERKIASHVMEHIRDGSCLQFGIGGVPNVVGSLLVESDLRDLGCHTEMLVDAYVDLFEAGRLTGARKTIDRGKMAYTFAVGGKRLYDFMDKNPAIASYNVEYINHPNVIRQNDNVVSINSALQVDLYSQINAESMGFSQISGNGGMFDFVLGAYWSRGGRSLICLPSTYTLADGSTRSRIVPHFAPGSITTIPRQMVNIIVTEYGWVSLKGDSTWARAEKLISIAHPEFREELIRSAERQKIWRKSSRIP
ncbi:MAG: acetyl-CoA hydrolase/transferase family protein [Spirochaetota bacterium]